MALTKANGAVARVDAHLTRFSSSKPVEIRLDIYLSKKANLTGRHLILFNDISRVMKSIHRPADAKLVQDTGPRGNLQLVPDNDDTASYYYTFVDMPRGFRSYRYFGLVYESSGTGELTHYAPVSSLRIRRESP